MSAATFAALSCMALAGISGMAGAGLARFFWAQDLEQAIRIDELRSQTEGHLRNQISSMEKSIKHLNEIIDIRKR